MIQWLYEKLVPIDPIVFDEPHQDYVDDPVHYFPDGVRDLLIELGSR